MRRNCGGCWDEEPQIRNPKSEARNNLETRISHEERLQALRHFGFPVCPIRICFGFRHSNFGFLEQAMKAEELAFVNQQLAEMLRAGIPLEGALRQLCTDMHRGELRRELELLVADLANGVPLTQALAARTLPGFYVQMLNVGVASNDLPGVLTLVADYYERANSVWTRLRGLMVYPFILLGGLLVVSIVMALTLGVMRSSFRDIYDDLLGGHALPALTRVFLESGGVIFWVPVFLVAAALVVSPALAVIPRLRERWRWKLPAFREFSLWQCASAMQIMLQGGCTFSQAVALAQELEKATPAADELARWQQRLRDGHTRFSDIAAGSQIFPPLFVWMVHNARGGMADGFRQAAEIYHRRAIQRVEAMLYAALPVSVIVLGLAIFVQMFFFVIAAFMPLISCLGALGG
jgi:type II secretory pathway component PulF